MRQRRARDDGWSGARSVVPCELSDQLHNLRVFIRVAEVGGVSRATGQLFKAPSAITRSVLDLEHAIGHPLFERRPRGMLLNACGRALLVRALRIQAEIAAAAARFVPQAGDQHGLSAGAVAIMLFNGRKLRLVVQLAALRGISPAAARMGMTQAGASMALSRLEAALGQPLFERRVEGMRATENGECLAFHARRVFAELRHAASDLAGIAGDIAGTVVIGSTPLGRTALLTAAIADATRRHPDLRVSTIESSYEQLALALRNGGVDLMLGVVRSPPLAQGLEAEVLFADRLAVLAGRGHRLARRGTPMSLRDLTGERWILPRPNALGRSFVEASFGRLGLPPPAATVETGDLAITRQLLTTTDMIAVTSPRHLASEMATGAIVELPVDLPAATRDVGIATREGALLSAAARAVRDAIRHRLTESRREQAA